MFCRGDVISFNYGAGTEIGSRVAKVLSVRDTDANPVTYEAIKARPTLRRNRYLVTVKQADSRIRSFYTDEIGPDAKRVGLLGRLVLYVQGVRF